jgi:alkanesulfonate monooxygenase SsuD/methylene tetrahydromethanopterin reductase-like flavin-dependent oxidoreductase (luciferase family)
MGNLLEKAKLADQLGLKLFAVGEHHRPDLRGFKPRFRLSRPRDVGVGSESVGLSPCSELKPPRCTRRGPRPPTR